MIGRWLADRRQTKDIEKALATLSVPEIPDEVSAAWAEIPDVSVGTKRKLGPVRQWALALSAVIIGIIFSPQMGRSAFAQTVDAVSNPNKKLSGATSSWFTRVVGNTTADYIGFFGFIAGVLLLLAALLLWVRQRKEEGVRSWREDIREWVVTNLLLVVVVAILIFSRVIIKAAAGTPAAVHIPIALIVGGLFWALVIATVTVRTCMQSRYTGFMSYLRHVLTMIGLTLLFLFIYATHVAPVMKGLPSLLFWLSAVVGWLVAPTFATMFWNEDEEQANEA